MADPKGFLKVQERELPKRRPVPLRLMDWKEVYEAQDPAQLRGPYTLSGSVARYWDSLREANTP
mgnify:CR=1 FL=1